MELEPIRNKKEHQAALEEIETLWSAKDGSPAADRLEVLNRVRSLSLEMIRSLTEGLKIPADVLVQRYKLAA